MSSKGKIIQSIVMYKVISKRKMALDQFRKGLTTLSVLDEMSKHPHLFENVFTFRPVELTPTTVKDCLKYIWNTPMAKALEFSSGSISFVSLEIMSSGRFKSTSLTSYISHCNNSSVDSIIPLDQICSGLQFLSDLMGCLFQASTKLTIAALILGK